MQAKTEKTKIEGVILITLDFFSDHRGEYVETYNEDFYKKSGIGVKFVQDDYSISRKNVLRGIHGDLETWKLIFCPYGEIFLVVADCRNDSPEFGKWQSFILSNNNHKQVLVPPGCGNGHLILSEQAVFSYKQSTYYNSQKQFSYKWDDPRFNIKWPIGDPILSNRDRMGRYPREEKR